MHRLEECSGVSPGIDQGCAIFRCRSSLRPILRPTTSECRRRASGADRAAASRRSRRLVGPKHQALSPCSFSVPARVPVKDAAIVGSH